MRRPFFFLAVFISFLIWTAGFFIKYDNYHYGHMSYFVSGGPRPLAVDGVIVSAPILKHTIFGEAYSFLVSPRLVKAGEKWYPARGIISVTSYKDRELAYGEEILFEAEIKGLARDKDSEKYTAYLRRKGIAAFGTIKRKGVLVPIGEDSRFFLLRFAYKTRSILKERIDKTFSAPARYFLDALVLGERQDISRRWKDIFVNTQTIHLLAISGQHVAIILFILLFLTGLIGLPRNAKYTATTILVLFYSVMVGWTPSIARAAIMGTVLMSSYIFKRDADIYNSLGLAACIILAFQPNQLFDMGFILSFASVLSLAYIMPKINRAFGFDKIDRKKRLGGIFYYIAMLFSGSLAVWLGIFPIVLYFFNLVSLVSIIVNILAIPCMFVVMSLAISALIFQPLCAFIGTALKEASEFFIAVLLWFLDLSSKIPFAYFKSAQVNVIVLPLYYFILFALIGQKEGIGHNS